MLSQHFLKSVLICAGSLFVPHVKKRSDCFMPLPFFACPSTLLAFLRSASLILF